MCSFTAAAAPACSCCSGSSTNICCARNSHAWYIAHSSHMSPSVPQYRFDHVLLISINFRPCCRMNSAPNRLVQLQR